MATRIDLPCAELRRLYREEQLSMAGIAAIFGCSPATISSRMRVYGIIARSGRFQARPIPEAILALLYSDKALPIRMIAAHFGVSIGTIHNRRRAYGIPARDRRHH